MVLEGVRLMAVGMFTVFAFLTLLVGLMHGSAAFFAANAHRFPEDRPDSEPEAAPSSDDAERALAIALAHARRQGRGIG